MFRKNYFTFLLAVAFFLISSVPAYAQYAQISGRIELTKADGTKAPVAGALVEIFRLDQKVKLPTDKTDKKGNFAFAGVLLGGRYVLAVSGPGIAPTIFPNVAPGADNIVVAVSEGDGKRLTEEEAKQMLTSRTNTNTNTTANTTQTTTVSETDKKREEEIKKQNEKAVAENEKINKANEIISTSQKEGNKAFTEKNYDLAITHYETGYNAAPTFARPATFFLNNLAGSLLERGKAKYKTLTKENKASILEAAKPDWQKAADSSDKALEILKTATPKDEKEKVDFEERRLQAIRNRKEAYYLLFMSGADRTKGKETIAAFREYLVIETDAAEKTKAQFILAEVLFDTQEADQALVEYEKILAENPNNFDALAGVGFTLVTIAYTNNEDKAKFQQAVNYLQKFVDAAPDTHPRKADAKSAIDTIKKDYKITPKKI